MNLGRESNVYRHQLNSWNKGNQFQKSVINFFVKKKKNLKFIFKLEISIITKFQNHMLIKMRIYFFDSYNIF